ncbi:GPI mannosyltransferase 1 isoform X1 [Tetranychus urticae]|uniref:GPI alpha-1,4-mannosyltransferase I, catalytic subunit n=1 Tax=Tetranychus urticae TaxID=32264 RepID=T1KD96_TETUR|nr:GPI mannosyltransferase 1 isoform X1 [Tetranychus urticae]
MTSDDIEENDSLLASIETHLVISSVIRIFLIFYGWVHDQIFRLQYTDIDYIVFTDGSRYMKDGRSPFLRHGYRYSPLIAFLMLPNVYLMPLFGKFLFAALDIVTGYLIYKILVHPRVKLSQSKALISSLIWLYNPLPMIISTRGSADTLITFLVLGTIYFILSGQYLYSGLLYGLAIHCKIYPIIYSLPIYLFLSGSTTRLFSSQILSPFNRAKLTFFFSSFTTLALITYGYYLRYGHLYLKEAWLYHINRKDDAHNFSPYFYAYKTIRDQSILRLLSYVAFIPQVMAILYYSIRYCIQYKKQKSTNHSINLMFALFSSTYLFVTLNKVVTSQYFIWYLCFVPILYPFLKLTGWQTLSLCALWFFGQGQWLLIAYLYQYLRWNVLGLLACCSMIFMIINLVIQFIIEKNFVPKPTVDQKSD